MFRRPFFFGRLLGLFLLLGGLLWGFSAAYRAGQMRGYMMGAMTAYHHTMPRGESAGAEIPMPFHSRRFDDYGGWGMRPHFSFITFFFPLFCLLPAGLLLLGGLFFRRYRHHGKHGPMGGPWGQHPGEGRIDPDEPIQKA